MQFMWSRPTVILFVRLFVSLPICLVIYLPGLEFSDSWILFGMELWRDANGGAANSGPWWEDATGEFTANNTDRAGAPIWDPMLQKEDKYLANNCRAGVSIQ